MSGANPVDVPLASLMDISGGVTLLDHAGEVLGSAPPPEPDAPWVEVPITHAGVVGWLGNAGGDRLIEASALAVRAGDSYRMPLTVRLSAY